MPGELHLKIGGAGKIQYACAGKLYGTEPKTVPPAACLFLCQDLGITRRDLRGKIADTLLKTQAFRRVWGNAREAFLRLQPSADIPLPFPSPFTRSPITQLRT
jgi:hypothetical protein